MRGAISRTLLLFLEPSKNEVTCLCVHVCDVFWTSSPMSMNYEILQLLYWELMEVTPALDVDESTRASAGALTSLIWTCKLGVSTYKPLTPISEP